MTPSTNGANGRDACGRFAAGNPGGPGNPQARRVHRLRSALLKAITPNDMAEVVRALLDKAKAGDVVAIRELLDRTIGKPAQAVQVMPPGDGLDVVARESPEAPDRFKKLARDLGI